MKASFFRFFESKEVTEMLDESGRKRVNKEMLEMFNIAEEVMYELIPKALYYYLNLENTEIPQYNIQPDSGNEEDKAEESKSEELEEEEEDDKESENPAKPICLLQCAAIDQFIVAVSYTHLTLPTICSV
eukprot:TRINITY_DN15021_c0_g2_i3.p2 TRINITY_DN15021_c0_g2~~TRINITY_DN15021_c0_g2_i3.p2  ORF type:complete len:130 (-),score=47.36 TRINITY_DN15021_c0_g2_i3:18-407(-)